MAYDEKLADNIRAVLRGRRDVTERKMFGGVAFMCRNRMCCGIVGIDLMVRVADDEFEAVMRRQHVRPMDFTGKPLKRFVFISRPGFQTSAALRSWIECGERSVRRTSVNSTKARRR